MSDKIDKRKYPRFNKSLVAQVVADDVSLFVITSDLSENGLFVRSKRCFAPDTIVGIEIATSDNMASLLKGVVRRTIGTLGSINNGMGVEIVEKDETYIHFLKSLIGETGTNAAEDLATPGSQIISSLAIEGQDTGVKDDVWEKRQHKRYIVDDRQFNVQIELANEVKVIDISIGGISLKTERKLHPGKQYVLKLKKKDSTITVHGDVKWSFLSEYKTFSLQSGITPISHGDLIPIYTVGMQLTDVPANKLEKLTQFLESLTKINTDSDRIYHQNEFIDLSEYVLSECAETTEAVEKISRQQEDVAQPKRRKSIAEKRKSALSCGIEERSEFLRDPNKEVLLTVLENPKTTEMEIEKLAKLHTIPEEVIREIINNRAWMNHRGIVSALVNNPKTPPFIAVTLVNKLKKKDLKKLERNKGVCEIVRSVAKKLLSNNV